jgi:hypothetical protein
MKKISASLAFYKWIFPPIWLGALAFFTVEEVRRGAVAEGRWMALAILCFMATFGLLLMKKLVWDLADEVEDYGDSLLVRKGGEEERIPLSNIMNVSAALYMNPPRITLRLVRPGRFGDEISFCPQTPFSFNPFAKHRVADDLMLRVDRARRGRAG